MKLSILHWIRPPDWNENFELILCILSTIWIYQLVELAGSRFGKTGNHVRDVCTLLFSALPSAWFLVLKMLDLDSFRWCMVIGSLGSLVVFLWLSSGLSHWLCKVRGSVAGRAHYLFSALLQYGLRMVRSQRLLFQWGSQDDYLGRLCLLSWTKLDLYVSVSFLLLSFLFPFCIYSYYLAIFFLGCIFPFFHLSFSFPLYLVWWMLTRIFHTLLALV